MNTSKILIALLFLIAFVLFAAALFYPKLIDREDREMVVEEGDIVVQEPVEETETTTWKTSRDHFIVAVPSTWEVVQMDAGGESIVTISDPEDSKNELIIELALSSTLDGQPIAFNTWVNETLIEADRIEDCSVDTVLIDGADCYSVTKDGITTVEYFGVADSLTNFHIILSLQGEEVDGLGSPIHLVLGSVNFNPTVEELEGAQIIP